MVSTSRIYGIYCKQFLGFHHPTDQIIQYIIFIRASTQDPKREWFNGYATNWLAITMLFKPVHKRPIFGQGLIPRQKNKIAERLAKTISSELLHPDLISEYVHRSAFIKHYKNLWVLRTKNILSDEGFRIEIQQIILELIIRIINEDEFRFNIASSIEAEVNSKLQNKAFDRIALKAYTILKGANVQN